MSTKHLFLTLLAAFSLAWACQRPEAGLSFPTIDLSLTDASVAEPASSFTVHVRSNRAWKATPDVDWIAIDPDSGPGSANEQPVTVTVQNNTGFDRTGHVVFDIIYDTFTLPVSQTGLGKPEDFLIYYNDFDLEPATQTYGTSGTSWPYLDQFGGWKNEKGIGVTGIEYKVGGISCRTNSASDGNYSDYAGSGVNNLLLGSSNYFVVKNMDLKGLTNFHLSFGSEKYDNNNKDSNFTPSEFLVYLSDNGTRWVPLSYEFKGTAAGRWNLGEGAFTVPQGTEKLSLYIMTTVASVYRLDDLKLEAATTAGTLLDFSLGVEMNPGGDEPGGGGDTPAGDPSGTGTLADPYNVAAARFAVKDLTWTSNTEYQKTGTVYVKGKISRIADNGTYAQSGTFGNATFYISDDGKEGNELYCYRILYLGNQKYTSGTDIKVGDEVVICGELMNYRGNTPETVSNGAYLYSLNESGGGGGGDTPSGEMGSGTLADPYTPAGAANAVKDLTWTSNTVYDKTDPVYVRGKISRIASNGTYTESGTFGNASFWISADGSQNGEFQAYRILYFGGQKYTSGTDIKVGDDVVIYGAIMNYRGNTPETVANEAWLYSLNGDTGGGDQPGGDTPGGDTPGGMGSGTQADPYTPAGARNAVKDLTWTSNTVYDATEEVYVKGKISRIPSGGTYTEGGTYGNASFYISEDGTETEEFYCFRILYLNNRKFADGDTDIKVGDEVVICGKLMNYRGNTPETVSGAAYLYALNPNGGGGGGDTPGGGGDTPSGDSIHWVTNSSNQTWTTTTDATYGAGYTATSGGMTVSYFKASSTSAPVAPNANHVRVYKNSHLSISVAGKRITGVTIKCAPNAGTSSYCWDLSVADGSTAVADKTALTVTWSGDAATFEATASNGQVRIEELTVTFK